MFRPIRKKKNEISPEQAEQLLLHCRRGVLAVNGEGGYPYAVPINFLFDPENQERSTSMAPVRATRSTPSGPATRCASRCTAARPLRDEAWAPYLQSAVVFGRCRLMESGPEATRRLKQFAMKYYPEEQLADREIAASGRAAQMFEITIEHVSGKEVQEK